MVPRFNEAVEAGPRQYTPAAPVPMHRKQQSTQLTSQANRDRPGYHPRRHRAGAKCRNDTDLFSYLWILPKRPFQDRTVDGSAIDLRTENHLQRYRMGARLNDLAKEASSFTQSGQIGSNDVVTGVRPGFVVSPHRSTHFLKSLKGALFSYDDVGKIYRLPAIPRAGTRTASRSMSLSRSSTL